MRKTGKRIKQRRAASPMIVACHLSPEVAGRDRVAVMALTQAWAGIEHLDVLLETQQMLVFGAEMSKDSEAMKVAQFADIAIKSIRERLERTNKIGATGDEIQALRLLADFADDWWKRKNGGLFSDAYFAVEELRKLQRGERNDCRRT